MDSWVEELRGIVRDSSKIVFFGGAGVSTESGIPDFRSVDGLYNQKYRFPPETILSHTFLMGNPEEFYRFYHDKLRIEGAAPNRAHTRLAELEAEGRLTAVITQNIDGLHQSAGSKNVYELHGSLERFYCINCGKKYPRSFVDSQDGVPLCACGGVVRPDVVLYEEGLDERVLRGAVGHLISAEVLIVGGTSLTVYPAAGLVNYFRGKHLVLINKGSTPYDSRADLLINEKIGEVFSRI